MNRARKVTLHNHGAEHEETKKIDNLVTKLATKFAEEESSRVGRDILEEFQEAAFELSPGKKAAKEQVRLGALQCWESRCGGVGGCVMDA